MNAVLQRKCGCGGTCSGCSKKDELHRSSLGTHNASTVPPIVHDVLRTSGTPLDHATRAAMEPRFQHDFSKVRVHSDERAMQSAGAVGALAYASGNHIVLGERSISNSVMAHELAHVAQNSGSDEMPQRIGAENSAAEREADRAADAAMSVAQRHEGTLHRYRSKTAPNFGVADKGLTAQGLKEEEFKDPKTQPWVEKIDIAFDDTGTSTDPDRGNLKEAMPIGTLTATYKDGKLGNITYPISGGTATLGLTDIVTDSLVSRIEGMGYNDRPRPVAERDPKNVKYTKIDPATKMPGPASMHFAIFFKGKQAIHGGDLKRGSHACVHSEPNPLLAQLNYHSREDHTKVSARYNSKALDPACCERIKNKGFTKKGEAAHPCEKTDPKACP